MRVKKSRLPEVGFVRLKQILAPTGPIPVSKSSWWAGVKSGRFPKPNKFFGPCTTVWDVREIRELLRRANQIELIESGTNSENDVADV